MIHLETNLLIGAEDETDAHHLTARLALARRDFFGCSAVVWMGLHSRPAPTPLLRHAMESLLTGGILSFDVKTAELAGELFYSTGSKRRTRLDTIIAATAIVAGAELATTNPADFQVFVPHGLQLHLF